MKNTIIISGLAALLILGLGITSFMVAERLENSITGKAIATAYIYQSPPEVCSVFLDEGLNLVSFNCEDQIGPLNKSLSDANNNTLDFIAVFSYKPNNPLDAWDSYNPHLPNYTIQTIDHLDRRKAYWVIMNTSGTYSKDGLEFGSTTLSLAQGWNFIGYPSGTTRNITEVLDSINGSYERVETYKRINPGDPKEWVEHIPPSSGNLTEMIPMEGYWIYMNESRSLVINW